jgi:transcriptional regulator with XRE-family HTH domain
MTPNEIISTRRKQLGADEAEIASRAGMSIYQYSDLEQYADEFTTTIDLASARRVCAALSLTLTQVLGLDCQGATESAGRALAAREARRGMGLSLEQLADELGREKWVLEKIEADDSAWEEQPLEFLVELLTRLKLPLCQFIE